MLICILWWHRRPRPDSGKCGIVYIFSKMKKSSTYVNEREVTGLLKRSQEVNDWVWIFSVERLVLHLDGDFPAHLPNPTRHVIVIPLRLLNETFESTFNRLLVLLSDWYYNFGSTLWKNSITRSGNWRAVLSTAKISRAYSILVTAIIKAHPNLSQDLTLI